MHVDADQTVRSTAGLRSTIPHMLVWQNHTDRFMTRPIGTFSNGPCPLCLSYDNTRNGLWVASVLLHEPKALHITGAVILALAS